MNYYIQKLNLIKEMLCANIDQLDNAYKRDGNIYDAAYQSGIVRMKLGERIIELSNIIGEMKDNAESK